MASDPSELVAGPELDEKTYHPVDAIKHATQGSVITGSAGFLLSAAQNSLYRQNVGALGVLTRCGTTTAWFGMLSRLRRKTWMADW
jgi:hypothetical protein